VGVLIHTNSLAHFLKEVAFEASDAFNISLALSNYTIRLLHASKDKPDPRGWLLDPSPSRRAGGRMFLKSVGGFDDNDAEYLLNSIWNDRDSFLEVSSRVITPGWALLLLILGEHMQWKSEVDSIWYEGWWPLETLCFRYSLVASANELKSFDAFCWDIVQDRPDPEWEMDDE
ncbi:unnamed protein product, partial [Rhizoctonia solani]